MSANGLPMCELAERVGEAPRPEWAAAHNALLYGVNLCFRLSAIFLTQIEQC